MRKRQRNRTRKKNLYFTPLAFGISALDQVHKNGISYSVIVRWKYNYNKKLHPNDVVKQFILEDVKFNWMVMDLQLKSKSPCGPIITTIG